MSGVPVSIIKL